MTLFAPLEKSICLNEAIKTFADSAQSVVFRGVKKPSAEHRIGRDTVCGSTYDRVIETPLRILSHEDFVLY